MAPPAEDLSLVDRVLERIEPFRNGVLLVAVIATLVVGFQVPSARPAVARGFVYGGPALVLLLAWTRVRDAGSVASLLHLVLAGAAVALSAFAASHSLSPQPPVASARLGEGQGRLLELPLSGLYDATVHGSLPGARDEPARAAYEIGVVFDDGSSERLAGELSREVHTEPGRGGPPRTTVSVHETRVHELPVRGTNARVVVLELGRLRGSLTIELRRPFETGAGWLFAGAGLLLALGLATEVMSAARHAWTPITAALGFTFALGFYVALRFSPDQPLTAVFGALIAAVAAAAVGLFVGFGAVFAVSRLRRRG